MNKYRNIKARYNGMTFDSQKEMKRFIELELLQKAGEISDLKCQVKYELVPKTRIGQPVSYIADFVYLDKAGNKIIEDVKGFRGGQAYSVFVMKKKMLYYFHGLEVKEI